jgi:opacity protein-like surface antigen
LPVYAMLKSQIPIGSQLGITLDAGMGVNFMHLGQFSEKPIDNSGSSIENPFTSSTTNAFSATAGVGLKINHVIGDLPIELNYRYFYLGQGRFNHTNQASNTLNTGNVYAQAVMLTVEL